MPRVTDKTAEAKAIGFILSPIEITALNDNLFSTCAKTGQTFIERAMAFNQELMRFASERLETGTQLLRGISKCGSWEEAESVQSDIASSVTGTFLSEMPKLMEQAARPIRRCELPRRTFPKV